MSAKQRFPTFSGVIEKKNQTKMGNRRRLLNLGAIGFKV